MAWGQCLGPDTSDIAWGTAGEWAAATAGFLAFAAALALFFHERSVNREERAERERQQARLVYCQVGGFDNSPHDDTRRMVTVRPRVINNSDELISDIWIEVYDGNGLKLGDVAMEEARPHDNANGRYSELKPLDYDFGKGPTTFVVRFTDANGRRWERRRDRSLHRIRNES
jgi:hypothetical protein